MSIICAEDREAVLKRAQNAVDDGQPFNLDTASSVPTESCAGSSIGATA